MPGVSSNDGSQRTPADEGDLFTGRRLVQNKTPSISGHSGSDRQDLSTIPFNQPPLNILLLEIGTVCSLSPG